MTDLADIVTSAFWRVNPPDADPTETREWLDAFDALVQAEGRERATFLLRKLLDHARTGRAPLPPLIYLPFTQTLVFGLQVQVTRKLSLSARYSQIVPRKPRSMSVRA